MKRNRVDVSMRRGTVACLKKGLLQLRHRLAAFESFDGSGVPLGRALDLVQRLFGPTTAASTLLRSAQGEVAVPSPPGQSSPMDTDSGKVHSFPIITCHLVVRVITLI